MIHRIDSAHIAERTARLSAGDRVLLSGEILTARDAAHARLTALIRAKKPLPVELKGSIIYYCGPCPALPGRPVGACGPTTSARMDRFAPLFYERGVRATIGKGPRSIQVVSAIKKHAALYFAATGGAGALIADTVRSCSIAAFPDLGPEAIYRMIIEDLPLIVAADSRGETIYA